MDVDLALAANHERKIDRLVRNQNQIDFRVRHSAGLDDIFDRCSFGQLTLKPRLLRFQKEGKITLECQLNCERRHRLTRAVEYAYSKVVARGRPMNFPGPSGSSSPK